MLPDVTSQLPDSALASAPGVVFGTSPYAYTNLNLFAGKHITRIGIPVKSVKALDDNQTFTLSVVKTTSDAYEYVSKNVLTLPREQLAGKGISILGDSISTFQNWSNNTSYNSTIGSNAVYYKGSRDGFTAVSETWWMQSITRTAVWSLSSTTPGPATRSHCGV